MIRPTLSPTKAVGQPDISLIPETFRHTLPTRDAISDALKINYREAATAYQKVLDSGSDPVSLVYLMSGLLQIESWKNGQLKKVKRISLPSIKPEEAERLQFFLRELQGDGQVAFNLFVISESGFLMIRPHLLHILFEPKNRKSQSGEGYIERLRALLPVMVEEYADTDRRLFLQEELGIDAKDWKKLPGAIDENDRPCLTDGVYVVGPRIDADSANAAIFSENGATNNTQADLGDGGICILNP